MTIRTLIKPAHVPNLRIHHAAGLKKDAFLERVSPVRAIRQGEETLNLTWYPTTARDWTLWEGLHNAINKGDFSHVGVRDSYYPFGLILPRALHNLFERNDLSFIQRQLVAYLAGVLAYDTAAEEFMPDQVFPPVVERAKQARRDLFTDERFDGFSWEDFSPRLTDAFIQYTGAPPLEFLQSLPHGYREPEVTTRWWIDHEFHLGYGTYYFTETDWKTLIVEHKDDALLRAESDRNTWELWLHAFRSGELNHGSEASFFAPASTSGTIYILRQEGTVNYKIGWTTSIDPSSRVSSLQTGSPQRLELIGHFPAASQSTESALHRIFAASRTSGEWFTLTESQVSDILDGKWRRSQQIN